MKVLIVDDDVELSGLLAYALRHAGYETVSAYDGEQALQRFVAEHPDLVLLDVNLPKLDGYGVLAALRQRSDVPVLMLTVRDGEDDEIRGLDLGADDYLRKPFSPRALLARLRALTRRSGDSDSTGGLELGPLRIDFQQSQACVGGGTRFRLSPLESRLLRLLGNQPGKPLEAERILRHVWSDRDSVDREALKQLVHRLRGKLQSAGGDAGWLRYTGPAGYALDTGAGGTGP